MRWRMTVLGTVVTVVSAFIALRNVDFAQVWSTLASWLPEVTWVRTAAVVAVVLGIGFAACVVVLTVYGERPLHVLLRPFARLRFLHAERLEQAAVDLSSGLTGLRRAKSEALSYALVLHAFTTIPFLLAGALVLNVHGVRQARRLRST